MTRKRIADIPKLKGMHEVDAALMEIAKAQIQIDDIEGQMNTQIIGITEIANLEAKPFKDKIALLEKDVKEYLTAHKDELDGKTKVLNFGKAGFRLSTKITLPKGQEAVKELIKILKGTKMTDCINTKETVNKEALKKHKEEKLNSLGISLKKNDVFWYETFKEKLKDII